MSFTLSGNILIVHSDGILLFVHQGDVIDVIHDINEILFKRSKDFGSTSSFTMEYRMKENNLSHTLQGWLAISNEIAKFYTETSYNNYLLNRLKGLSTDGLDNIFKDYHNDYEFEHLLNLEIESNQSLKNALRDIMDNGLNDDETFARLNQIIQQRTTLYQQIEEMFEQHFTDDNDIDLDKMNFNRSIQNLEPKRVLAHNVPVYRIKTK